MKEIMEGEIENFVPLFQAHLNSEKILVLGEGGDIPMTVDTGFSGGIAIPLNLINEMGLELVDFDTFRLATGEIVELPIFLGKVIIKKSEIETWFIPGDSLLGMEFLYSAGSLLSLNFKDDTVKLFTEL